MKDRTPIRLIRRKNNDMKPNLLIAIIFPLFCCCQQRKGSVIKNRDPGSDTRAKTIAEPNPYSMVGVIPLPAGCSRVPVVKGSFAEWLRALPLKKDKMVHLYDGSL